MSAYIIFTRDKTTNQAEMDIYAKQAMASIAGHDLKPLAFYGAHEDLEGPATEGSVILEFPNAAAAKGWYESPAYRAAREHRFKGASYRVILIEGVQ